MYSNTFTTITGTTNVGIGTNNPTTALFVKPPSYPLGGNTTLKSPLNVQYYKNPGGGYLAHYESAIFVKWNGLIGVLTDNPLEEIHLNGTLRGGEASGCLKLQTDFGYLRFGALSNNYMHFYTDLPAYYFNKGLRVEESIIINNANGLGSGNTQIALNSDGSIRAREVKVDLDEIPDYVFKEDYKLMPLEELKVFIEENKHLPNVKSEADFKEEGSISLAEMNMKLL